LRTRCIACAYWASCATLAISLAGCGETRGKILWAADRFVVLVSETSTPAYGISPTTDNQSVDRCPANQAVVGYRGFLRQADADAGVHTPYVGQIATLCGSLSLDSSSPSQVVVTPSTTLASRGMWTGPAWQQTCPDDEVVVSFSGSYSSFIDRIGFQCARWVVSSATPGQPIVRGATTTLPPAGGTGGMTPFADACGPGQMATGSKINWGFFVDAFGLYCGTPRVASEGGAP
jgi:hypothetical protein